jgi:hypothetical protein
LPEDIDWRNALGIIFWYCCGSIGKLSKALELYETSSLPFPFAPKITDNEERAEDAKTEEEGSTQHILFSLLKMFFSSSTNSSSSSASSSQLNELISRCLTPEGYTQDQLDYRGSYLTLLLLESTGILPSSASSSASEQQQQVARYPQAYYIVRQHMISQLLSEGLWQWAVFVSLQYDDPTLRSHTVRDIILRHTSSTMGWELNKTSDEYFLMTRYGIDSQLLYESSAYHAKYHHQLSQEIYYLNQSQQYPEALSLICQQLVPLAIQNSTEMLIESLLNEMEEKYFLHSPSYLPMAGGGGGAGEGEGMDLERHTGAAAAGTGTGAEEKLRAQYFLWNQTGGLILSYLNLMNRFHHESGQDTQQDDGALLEMLSEALELFEKFQGNFFGLCGVSCALAEQSVMVKGAVYSIGSRLLETISAILRDRSAHCPAEYSQKFLSLLQSSSHESLPVHEADYLKYLRYEETLATATAAAAQGDGEREGYGSGDDEEKDAMR